jgi:pre-mRNA-splicing factor ATP-dependent RNA helicase DHX15/PRP43
MPIVQPYGPIRLTSPSPIRRAKRVESSEPSVNPYNRQQFSARYYQILARRKELPVWEHMQDFHRNMRDHNIIILVGETGSGKTTQIPQFALDAGYGKVCCTQPRRVAAMSVAKRVSEEMDVELGKEVGYSIRFEELCGPQTLLK